MITKISAWRLSRSTLIGTLCATTSIFGAPAPALSCDPCALFNVARLESYTGGDFTVALSEQLTSYERGDVNVKQGDLTRLYSTTQVSAAYDFTDRISVQLTLPFVVREFDEIRNFRLRERREEGVGDMSMVLGYSLLKSFDSERSYFLTFGAGVKLPTGDTGSLEDSLFTEEEDQNDEGADDAGHEHAAREVSSAVAHHQVPIAGGASGRILSLGSGSYDFPLLAAGSTRYGRWTSAFYSQYNIRQEGDFEYRFANDFLWSVRGGRYLLVEDAHTAAVMIALSGEHKEQDSLDGVPVDGSELSNLYLGPVVVFTSASSISAEIAVDLPVSVDDEEGQIEPTYRVQAAIAAQF